MHALRSTIGRPITPAASPTLVERQPSRVDRADPLVGALVAGKFRVESIIAEGGMGRVYLATHESVGRYVALKVVGRDRERDAGSQQRAQRRFRLEASVLARLRHPNIVTLYDFGELDDTCQGRSYLAMELLEGVTLAEHLDASTRLPVPEVLALAVQMVRGLRYAHGLGVLHRDMKPANIMLVPDENDPRGGALVKILDFGASKIAEAVARSESNRGITQDGFVVGTPQYMAPEQLGGRAQPASDLYAVGLIMFEALTGIVPKDLARADTGRLPRLREVAPDLAVSDHLEALVARLVSVAPALRPDADDLLDELLQCAVGLAVPPIRSLAPPAQSLRPTVKIATSSSLASRVLFAVSAVGCAFCLTLAVTANTSPHAPAATARVSAFLSCTRAPSQRTKLSPANVPVPEDDSRPHSSRVTPTPPAASPPTPSSAPAPAPRTTFSSLSTEH